MNMKKLFLLNLPYLLFVYPFDKLAQAFRLAPGADLSSKLLSIGDGFTAALSSPWLSFHPTDLLIGIAGAVVLRMAVYLKGKNAKKYRHGIEYGSARWGTAADIAPYMDKDFFQNIPMTQTERITMASRPKQPKYAILVDEEFSCLEFDMNRDTISWIRRKIEYRRSLMEHLPKKTSENGIGYTLVGDYYIPDLQLPEENRPIGIWGRMHKAYLEQFHPIRYNDLILTGKLWTYLSDLNEQAQNQLDCIITQMKETEEITEELKVQDQMTWVRAMNSIRNRAEEIILRELIYEEDAV